MSDRILVPTRKSLVARLRNSDDQEGWRQFFETYWKLIYSFALKRGCTDAEAEEVVQETVISVASKMPEYRYEPAVCSFKGWLLHVTNWRVIDQLRRRNHRLVSAQAPEGSAADWDVAEIPLVPEIERIWQEEWERNIMDAALERVKRKANPQHFQIFYLLLVTNRSVPDVMEALGVNRGQVYLAKHRVAAMVKREVRYLETRLV